MSVGEDRVRTKFNPSADGIVDDIKQKSAVLINLCDHVAAKSAEADRCAKEAARYYEIACMWAVKAATANV